MQPTASRSICPWSLEFGVKHTSYFKERRIAFASLVRSIRLFYTCGILVNIDGDHNYTSKFYSESNITEVKPRNVHLGRGRNELIRASTANYLLLMDDDVRFTKNTDVSSMILRMPSAEVVLGCYNTAADCYQGKFSTTKHQKLSALVQRKSTLDDAHIGHNFILLRPASLLRGGWLWDNRSFMMEHEIFFLKLWYSGRKVVIASNVTVKHSSYGKSEAYQKKSLRHKEHLFLGVICANFPNIGFFDMPYVRLNCARGTYCQRATEPSWSGKEPCYRYSPIGTGPSMKQPQRCRSRCQGVGSVG